MSALRPLCQSSADVIWSRASDDIAGTFHRSEYVNAMMVDTAEHAVRSLLAAQRPARVMVAGDIGGER